MKLQTILILILCAGLLVSLFFNVDQREVSEAYRIEKEQAQRHIKKQIDSVNRVIKRKDDQILKAMRQSAEFEMIARDAVSEAKKYQKKYESIKIGRAVNDAERDSILSVILSH